MKRAAAESAALTFAAVTLIGDAAHWYLTPMSHPNASHWQTARVVIQFAIGIAAAAYASHRVRVEHEVEREDAPRSHHLANAHPGRLVVPALLRFNGSVQRAPAIASWLAEQPDDLRSIAQTWFDRVRRSGADVRELMHDGLATACVDDAPFAYVGAFKEHVSVGFFHGAALPDPAGILNGTGVHMRHVKLKPGAAANEGALEALIAAAYRDIVTRLTVAE